jgi:hypothetical protein
VQKSRLSKPGVIALASLGVGLPLVIVTIVVVFAATLGGFRGNIAEETARPLQSQLEKTGARFLCENGDRGHGPDNLRPWYTAYYRVPDDDAAHEALFDAARSRGFVLLPATDAGNSKTLTFLESGVDNGRSTPVLRVTVSYDTTVPLRCSDVAEYGREVRTPTGGAIYQIEIEYPERSE